MPFFYRLNGPRPTFPRDAKPEEAAAMRAHSAYWQGLLDGGKALAFGPVFDPRGGFGLALLTTEDAAEARALAAADPALAAELGFWHELHPMPLLFHR